MGIKLSVIAALGAPALAVLIFEVMLNSTSMFSHAMSVFPHSWIGRFVGSSLRRTCTGFTTRS